MVGTEDGKFVRAVFYGFLFILLNFFSEQHHVKFIEETGSLGKENRINIQKLSEWSLLVHLGFLKLNHSYEIFVSLENPVTNDKTQWLANVICSLCFSF